MDWEAVTVLTTPERLDAFKALIGLQADYVIDPRRTHPLEPFMGNLAIGGGKAVVLDEAHFYSERDLASGLNAYLDSPLRDSHDLRPVVICCDRVPGDEFVSSLFSYSHVYDVVCAPSLLESASQAAEMLEAPRTRRQALFLLGPESAPGSGPECTSKIPTHAEHIETIRKGGFDVQVTVHVTPTGAAAEGRHHAER